MNKKYFYFTLTVICALLFMSTCFSPLDYYGNDTTLSVFLGSDNFDSSRSVRNPSFFQYEVEFTGPGQPISKTGSWGEPITVRIEPGTWNISVRAIDPDFSNAITVAFGYSNNIAVRPRQRNTTTIQMIFEVYEALTEYINWAPGGGINNPISISLDIQLNNDNWMEIGRAHV